TVNDTEAPAISGMPANVTMGTSPGPTSGVASWTAPTATDNCSGVRLTSDHNSGESFPIGMTTVTFTATDAAGNVTSPSFTVTVVDDTKPVIALGANVTAPNDPGQCSARIASLGTTATDNVPGGT